MNLDKASSFVEEVKTDRSKAIKVKRIEGSWDFRERERQNKPF